MKQLYLALFGFLILCGCGKKEAAPTGGMSSAISATPPGPDVTLMEARRGFQTKIDRVETEKDPVDVPPPNVFQTVQYDAAPGKLAAYLTPDPQDGKKHPAIIWITGGDCNSIGDVWEEATPDDDQTAAAFRKSGIVMMFPSLRGGNVNPGVKESFLGEVDDVLAAADYLGKQTFVDPTRIYLGGHSTGGTLVLLVAECSDRFRAVFSFGPVSQAAGYGPEFLTFDTSSQQELKLRSPILWLSSIKSPVFVLEGEFEGNVDSLRQMMQVSQNPQVHFLPVGGANHFNILAPATQLIASKVLSDNGPTCNIALTPQEVSQSVRQ